MLECKRILSQSFHGVVIAEAYGIPVLNFRQLPGAPTGLTEIDLTQPCTTDPRIFEFYQGGRRAHFAMYAQRRNERSDWAQIMRTIDRTWEPFDYDAAPLVEAFPFPLAYDPLRERLTAREQLQRLRF
jgi:Asp-tRNA(Asn)/Glu-tRNA(Gln) amidotransferase A subunit family amidase